MNTKEISKLFGEPFDKHTETDICFVNGKCSDCNCKMIYSDGYGEYANVIFIKLCQKHKPKKVK